MSVEFLDDGAVAVYKPGNGNTFRYRNAGGTYYHEETPAPVVAILEESRRTGRRIRLHYGDRDTGRDWLEEHDVTGSVGRSMGPLKVPLMIHNARSHGGGAILTDCIVRIRDASGGRDLWRHPIYHAGKATVREISPDEMVSWHRDKPPVSLRSMGYTHGVDVEGRGHEANFKSEKAARSWIRKMGLEES